MGEVYKATDPRLHRTVAIKILHDHISASLDARARFEREAQTIGRLNHPHICVIYDVGRHEKTDYLVMELLEGETLAQRLERGSLPLDQALRYAVEISDALDKAHRQGITHRDLKPGNIMLSRSGLKLLDFGLAKWSPSSMVSSLSQAPTNADVTAEGTILGSIHYMSPEQLEGGASDPRSDIFAFGAVLYEMLTGRKAYDGKSSVSVMSAILKDTPPPVSQLQPVSPPAVDRLISRCLEKNPDERWQSAGDLTFELKWLAGSGRTITETRPSELKTPVTKSRTMISAGTAAWIALILALGAGLAVWLLKPTHRLGDRLATRVSIPLPPGYVLSVGGIPPIALSPDGTRIVYVSKKGNGSSQLFLRSMNSQESKPIDGTTDATGPFFSPNGKWIGFFAEGKLKKVPTSGGAPEALCPVGGSNGGTWGEDDSIYYAPFSTSGIWKASGGKCEELTKLDRSKGEVSHRAPQILPGGKALLFTVWTGPGSDEKHLHVYTLATGVHRELVHGASSGHYVASGHLLYSRAGALMVVPFDLANLKLNGSPVAMAELAIDIETAFFAVSDSGTLAYVPVSPRKDDRRLVWVDGVNVTPLPITPGAFFEPSISPGGEFAAVTKDGPVESIWILEFRRNTLAPFTSTSQGTSQAPVWTRDGKRIAYRGTRTGFRNVYWKTVDGSSPEERLTTSDDNQTPGSFSPEDKKLAFSDIDLATAGDIWTTALDENRKPTVFLRSPAFEAGPSISPDGHWLAYSSAEAGRREIYVLPFPGPGGKRIQISTDGGFEPVWSHNQHELYFRNSDKMMAVDVSRLPDRVGSARVLFEGQYTFSDTGRAGYDVAKDGRFLMVQPTEPEQPATQINLVLDWFDELKSLAPAN
jgi:serine/threonine-protein kinase